MQVVGIDFGTTNIRIATWDAEAGGSPQPQRIDQAGEGRAMPAVIALERAAGGEIIKLFGEDADAREDDPNARIVIRNIKRLAADSDSYVRWHLEARNAQAESPRWPPSWWNPASRTIEAWGKSYPVWELISELLAEALRRADIDGPYEWRAGCPVHTDLEYRQSLTDALSRATGVTGRSSWVIEEPSLFLLAAEQLSSAAETERPISLSSGSYLIYDMGGGSFDCALIETREGSQTRIYGANGHPLLGGADVDELLAEKLRFAGERSVLRKAKEDRNRSNPSETLSDGTTVTLDAVESVLKEGRFVEKSMSVARDAYIGAKLLWKREEGPDDPPVGEVLQKKRGSGEVRFVWQLLWEDLANDVDQIILFGGPTKSEYFRESLARHFGDKITTAQDMDPADYDLAITGASIGACYAFASPREGFVPLYVNRIPASISLEDTQTGDKVEYQAFQHLASPAMPLKNFVSQPLAVPWVSQPGGSKRYKLTVDLVNKVDYANEADPDNGSVEPLYIDHLFPLHLHDQSFRFIIDSFGRVAIMRESPNLRHDETRIAIARCQCQRISAWPCPNRRHETRIAIASPPWQTPEQADFLREKLALDEKYRNEQTARIISITHPNYTRPSNY